MAEDILQANKQLINRRLKDDLGLLREYYPVDEHDLEPAFAKPTINGRAYRVRSFDIWDVGNLVMLSTAEAGEIQSSSFVIMPYYKNLPLFISDYACTGEQRSMVVEACDLTVTHDETFDQGIDSFKSCADAWNDMADLPIEPCWYDDLRLACIAKAPHRDQDSAALWRLRDALDLFIKMERCAPPLDDAGRARKWELNKEFSDRLIEEGTRASDRWTVALGVEDTRRFLDEAFFGSAHYAIS